MVRPKPFRLSCDKFGSVSTFTMGDMASVMCPRCYNIKDLEQFGMCNVKVVDGEGADLIVTPRYHLECGCGYIGAWISLDYAISRIVQTFNINGYKTALACSGHENDGTDTAIIKFEVCHDFIGLPDGWYVDREFIKCDNPSNESFEDLLVYARSLDKLYK